MLKRIHADQVRLGMYVRKFEGRWLHHPFWWARFVVDSDRKLGRIRDAGLDLWIDSARGVDLANAVPPAAPAAMPMPAPFTREPPPRPKPAYSYQSTPTEPPSWTNPTRTGAPRKLVAPAAFGKADKVRAQALARRSTQVVKELFKDQLAGGSIPAGRILSVVGDIAGTLELNSSAFLNVTRLKSKNDGLYTHSVAVCAMMIGLARELGLPPAKVEALGIAGLLHDVGKVQIDDALLRKGDDLTAAEQAELHRAPQIGHDLLQAEVCLPEVARDVVLHHQERLDGSGYPFGHRGDAISQAARMAAICDTFETLTSATDSGKGLSAAAAVAAMNAMDRSLDGALLFRFMRSIGVFPPEMLVRLRSNRLAVVLPSQGDDRRTTVRAFYSTVETSFIDYADAALGETLSDDQALSVEEPTRWFAGSWDTMLAAILAGKPVAPVMNAPARQAAAVGRR